MVESLLVPTDGSDGALVGARRGIDLAAAVGADLHTLSVVDTREVELSLPDESDGRTEQTDRFDAQAQRAVEAVAELARPHLPGSVTTAVEWGVPFRSITEYVETHGIDLVAMGTHGHTGLERFLLGSVTEKTLRTASVPVFTVPMKAAPIDIGEGAYDDILLPTDGSAGAEVAIDWAMELADVYDATVHTVYSVDTSRFPTGSEMADVYDALEARGRAALETVRERADAAGVSVAAQVATGPAARMILSHVDSHDIDLIVMGTHGRSGAERYLIGSVTEKVVRNADVPVCAVPMALES